MGASIGVGTIVAICVAAVVVLAFGAVASATFTVEQQTRAIVERFGKCVRVEHPA